MMMLSANFGFLDFLGIGVMRVTEDRTQTTNMGNGNYDTTVTSFNIGFQINMGFDLGFFYQPTTFTSKGSFAGEGVNQDIDMPRVGFGVGVRGKSFHFEVGYVKDLEEMREDQGGGASAGTNVATYSTVESQELPSTLSAGVKYKTTSTIIGAQLSYTYNF